MHLVANYSSFLSGRLMLGKRFPTPNTHDVFGFELVTQIACQNADLTSMMRIVLDEITQHVDCAAWHALYTGLASSEGGFEQTREISGGLAQRSLRLQRRRTNPIQRWRARPHTAHSSKHASYALYVSHDGRNRASATARWIHVPEPRWEDLDEIFIHQTVLPENVN